MDPVRVIPVLLLKNWGVEKSIRFSEFVYVGSPINAARVFSDLNADELIVLDILASPEGRGPRLDVIHPLADEVRMPLTVGGGIRNVSDIQDLLATGADRIVINTAALERPELIREAAERFGSQCVVVSIDARRQPDGGYLVASHGNRRLTARQPAEWARAAANLGAGEILVNAIDRDGTLEGYDLELLGQVSAAVEVPVIACGGASSLADLARAVDVGGAQAVAAGALFLFWGRRRTVLINYPSEDELVAHLGRDRVRRRTPSVPRWLE